MGIAEGKASALGYTGACPSRVRDTNMCLAGPHLPVFNSFSFTHPLSRHLLSTYCASDSCRPWRHSSKQSTVPAFRKLCSYWGRHTC